MIKKLSPKQEEALSYLKANPNGISYTMWGNKIFSTTCPPGLTLKSFKSLVDRELADIGLSRGDVPFVARETASV